MDVSSSPLLLAGDIGGTKTDLAVVSAAAGPRELLATERYPSGGYVSLDEMARVFLDKVGLEVQAACFDVAGPVFKGEAQLTNLAWHMDETSLASALGLHRVWLINDLVAIASAVPLLRPDELYTVVPGEPVPGSALAVLAPGTGLGEAFLVPDEAGVYRAYASEGGHAGFAPSTELELDLLRDLWRQFDHVSFERVASGVGIPNLYDFLRSRPGLAESPRLAEELAATKDRTHPIIAAALEGEPDPLAQATVDVFLRILGTEATNLVLKILATGGVYLAGGIAQVLREKLRTASFLDAVVRAGRFSSMLQRVPVHVVMGEVALLGAASQGLRLLEAIPAATRDWR